MVSTWMKEGGRRVVDFMFPPACAGCGKLAARPGALCTQCWETVTFIERPYCEVLGIPFSHDLGPDILSAAAIADPPPFDRLRAAVTHDGVARNLIHSLKYNDRLDLAPMLALWMARAGGEHISNADYIIPVPLHRTRFLRRQFNQSAELSRALARHSGKPLRPDALIRTKRTDHQVGLVRSERQENVRGAFTVGEDAKMYLTGKKVVIVDDVYTTGATVWAASKALRRAKVADITVLTFAMALDDTMLQT